MIARLCIAATVLATFAPSAFAGRISNSVPALDDLGLAGLMILVGIAGGIATRIRRRK